MIKINPTLVLCTLGGILVSYYGGRAVLDSGVTLQGTKSVLLSLMPAQAAGTKEPVQVKINLDPKGPVIVLTELEQFDLKLRQEEKQSREEYRARSVKDYTDELVEAVTGRPYLMGMRAAEYKVALDNTANLPELAAEKTKLKTAMTAVAEKLVAKGQAKEFLYLSKYFNFCETDAAGKRACGMRDAMVRRVLLENPSSIQKFITALNKVYADFKNEPGMLNRDATELRSVIKKMQVGGTRVSQASTPEND